MSAGERMELRILGSVEITVNGTSIALGTTNEARVLAILAAHANETVPADRLIEGLWPENPPRTARARLVTRVADARRLLGSVGRPRSAQRWLLTESPGYVLQVSTDELDAAQFSERSEAGRAALRSHDYATAAAELRAALAVWRGPAFGELGQEVFARRDAARLDEARLTAIEDRVDADLALGRHLDLCPELAELVALNPRCERLRRQLILALYRSDRQADALNVAAQYRQLAVQTPDAPPSAEFRQLEQDVLLQKSHLDWVRPAGRVHRDESHVAFTDPSPSQSAGRDPVLDIAAPARSLVGRRAERQWLLDRLEEAQRGLPQVVLLRGEVGVGKSRLARALIEEASHRGITTSIGRFREQGGVPFDAFTDDLFPRLADVAPDDPELRRHAAILRRLATFGSGDENTFPSTEAQRIAAVREGFAHLIRREPLVMLVDDVQWADAASRDLLVILVRLAVDAAVHGAMHLLALIVVRDEPGVPELPQLDLIRRENITTSLTLHGLSELEVSRLAHEIGADDLSRGIVGDITRVTRGNPLFVGALVKQFTSNRGAGTPHALSGRLPSEVEGLIGSRVAGLSPACQEMLTVAAVLGRGWSFGELEAVTAVEPATLGELLDEAERAEVLVAASGTYDFAHPLYERAALMKLNTRKRQETHARIAEVLIQQHARHPGGTVLPIAQHLIDAGDLADPALVLEYCPPAGNSASAGLAWPDAARYYEAALRASDEVPSALAESRVQLALQASWAHFQNGEPATALRAADVAIAALGEDAPPEELAAAWSHRLRAELYVTSPGRPVDTGPLEALASEFETTAPSVAARIYGNLASVYASAAREVEEAREICRRAIDLGSRHGEHGACADGWGQLAVTQWMRLELVDAVESLRAEALHATEASERQKLSHAMTLLPLTLVWLGRFDDAEVAIEQARSTTREVSYSLRDGFLLVAEALIAAARGMYMDSDAAVEDAIEIGRLTSDQWPAALIIPVLAATRSTRGDEEGTEAVLQQWVPANAPADRKAFAWLLRQRLAVAAGDVPDRKELEAAWKAFSSVPRISTDTAAALVIELAADAGATDLVREAAEFLDELERRGQRFTTTMGLFIPRMLGVAAQTVGDTTRARTWLHESIDLATRLRAHAELAASQYALASLLAQEGDAAAAPLVETAHRATRALGMLPLAARCAELAQRLGVPRAATQDVHDAPDAQYGGIGATQMAVVVFMDIADSVALTEELGDWVFYDRSRALQASLRAVIKSFAGSPVEGIKLGDGILAEFGSAERAVSCALACSSLAYDTGLPVHIGAHAGDVVRGDGDIFGGTVNTAARICSHASAGEIIVSRTIRDLARTSSTVQFASLGAETFKGIAEPVQLYSVHAG